MATFFSQIQNTFAANSGGSGKEDVDAATFLAATRESSALLGNLLYRLFVSIAVSATRY